MRAMKSTILVLSLVLATASPALAGLAGTLFDAAGATVTDGRVFVLDTRCERVLAAVRTAADGRWTADVATDADLFVLAFAPTTDGALALEFVDKGKSAGRLVLTATVPSDDDAPPTGLADALATVAWYTGKVRPDEGAATFARRAANALFALRPATTRRSTLRGMFGGGASYGSSTNARGISSLSAAPPRVFAALPLAYRDFLICRYDPFVGLFRFAGPLWLLLVGGGLLLLGVFIGRPYCRYLCPYGAILSLLSRASWRGVTVTPDKELDCGLCAEACPYGAIENLRAVRSRCLSCGRCYKHCPRHHASAGVT